MQRHLLRTLLLSVGFLGVASTAGHAGKGSAPKPAATSTDPDAESASSDPQSNEPQSDESQSDEPQDGGDKAPPAKDKGRNHPEHKKHHRRLWPEVRAELRAREEQVDKALHKLLSAKGQALQLLHGVLPQRDRQENPGDDAPAADQ